MKNRLFALLFFLLFLTGCGKEKIPEPSSPSINLLIETTEPVTTEIAPTFSAEATETTVTTQAPKISTELEPTSQSPSLPQPQELEHPSTGYGLYDALIEKCIWASLNCYVEDLDILEEMQISTIFRYGKYNLSLCFTTMDIDNDGVEELVIHDRGMGNCVVYAAYSVDNSQLIWLLNGCEKNRYYLCTDGKIANHLPGGPLCSWTTYAYANSTVSLIDCYFRDELRIEEHYWYYSQKEVFDPDAIMVSEEAFNDAVANMEQTYMTLDGTTLQDYMAQDEQAIRSDAALAAYREAQLHGKEKYQLWDTVLNRLWRILKYRLSSEEMKQLTQEQLAWIDQKEAAAENVDSEKGFEIQAEYTKERIDTLLGLLRETDYYVEEN